MQYRPLGDGGPLVSEIALGSWLTYGEHVDRHEAVACVQRAFDLGVTLFDTANVYGRGTAETVLGEALRSIDRSSYLLASKVYFPMGRGELGLSAAQIRKQCDASLARLGTDYLDIYQCHRFDSVTPLAETMAALTEVIRMGKVRFIGFSEWTPSQVEAALAIPGTARFVSSQPQYSLLWRKPEAEVLPFCASHGIGQIVYSPLAQGVLTGKYRPGASPPPDSRAAHRVTAAGMARYTDPAVLAAVQRLAPVAARAGTTLTQLALAWVLREPRVSAAIVGARRPEQLDESVTASGIRLGPDLLEAVDDAVAAVVSR